jgi:hypothetical protein
MRVAIYVSSSNKMTDPIDEDHKERLAKIKAREGAKAKKSHAQHRQGRRVSWLYWQLCGRNRLLGALLGLRREGSRDAGVD